MEFGTFLLLQSPSTRSSQEIFGRGIELAQAAESLGFNSTWLAEHHFSTYGYLSRPVQLATYIAAKTTRMRIGTAVIVVPLHQPLLVAEEIATLDVVSGGRADVGLGRGYQQYEFQRFGYELDEGRKRWDECIDIIFKALEGKPFTYEGKTSPDIWIETDDGERSVICSQFNLRNKLIELRPIVGDRIAIVYTSQRKAKLGMAKLFDVSLKRADGSTVDPAPAPATSAADLL